MSNKIERRSSVTSSITVNALSTCPRIPYGASAGGVIIVTAVSGATTIQWMVAPEAATGEAYAVYSGGSAVTTTISANRAYPVPDALFAAPFIVPATDAGTATIIVMLKG